MSVENVRLLIADEDPDNQLLTDDQITRFLVMEPSVKRAAAQALDTIASSESLLSKKIKDQDIATDGPAVAADLRAHARALRAQDDEEQAGEAEFGIITASGQVI